MADEQYRWLDRETVERLLSGEPLEAVDATDCDQAGRLAQTLGALSAPPPPAGAELPGEAAALAAFRKARAGRGGTAATACRRTHGPAVDTGPAADSGPAVDTGSVVNTGLVHLDRRAGRDRSRRRFRPARLALAAALAVGMVGGVAVAAGTGAFPTPFRLDEPEPAASVSAAENTEQPPAPPSTDGSVPDRGTPNGPPSGGTDGGSRNEAGGGRDTGRGSTPHDKEQGAAAAVEQAKRITSACRDMRDGKELSADRKRVLEGAAGSATRVWKYCQGVLAAAEAGAGARERKANEQYKGDSGEGDSGEDREDDRDGRGDSAEQGGKGGDDGPGISPSTDRRSDGAAALPDTSLIPTEPVIPTVSAAPTEPVIPTVSAAPTEPVIPAVSAAPTEPVIPAVSAAPTASVSPAASAISTASGVPTVPAEAAEAAQSLTPRRHM